MSTCDDGGNSKANALADAVRITTELFGEVQVKESFDPSFADDKYLVLIVRAKGTAHELLAMEYQWIERILNSNARLHDIRLSLRPIQRDQTTPEGENK